FPWVSVMPTGGVSPTEENLRAWFDAGVSLVGMGSKMIRKDLIASGDYATITKIASDTIALIKDLKS
ncbi:MAG TPA: bifunctional 4-hydroxy-2-oxoglutarate aldolase/2-dehydro-3-deoxy-phosphogluconate aldolase, partial [Saprospiraceae bacterium]|nr:bifunctional 4-hydroxy-2-oxoglutarate aldolase/2-dehydro-3-deoxy-phosphogluconate aldolase [Saprospiraceae bacterium]